jgi:hypothetical protein
MNTSSLNNPNQWPSLAYQINLEDLDVCSDAGDAEASTTSTEVINVQYYWPSAKEHAGDVDFKIDGRPGPQPLVVASDATSHANRCQKELESQPKDAMSLILKLQADMAKDRESHAKDREFQAVINNDLRVRLNELQGTVSD